MFSTSALATLSSFERHSYAPRVVSPRLIDAIGRHFRQEERVHKGKHCSRMPTHTPALCDEEILTVASTLFSTSARTKG